jgi:hypothetical protein
MESKDTGDTGIIATQILIEIKSGHGTTSSTRQLHKTCINETILNTVFVITLTLNTSETAVAYCTTMSAGQHEKSNQW